MSIVALLPAGSAVGVSANFALGDGQMMQLVGASRPVGDSGAWQVDVERRMTDGGWDYVSALSEAVRTYLVRGEGTYRVKRVSGTCIVDGDVDNASSFAVASTGGSGTAGPKGDKGDKGDPGSAAIPQNANADLSLFQVVYGTPEGGVLPASPTDDATIDLILGVTLSAVATGQAVQVQRSGLVTDPSLAIYPAGTRLYLGAGGTLTTIAPSAGYDVFIGTALGAGRVFLDVQPPIFLE